MSECFSNLAVPVILKVSLYCHSCPQLLGDGPVCIMAAVPLRGWIQAALHTGSLDQRRQLSPH